MPFTLSHPAIVLPLSRIQSKYISTSCLVVGSITPDFEYFITMKLTGRFSHSLPGVFAFDLPVALALVFIFHLVVKKPMINRLPTYFHARLITLRDVDFVGQFKKYFPGYILCLFVGIFSHLLWDSFTHSNAVPVQLWPVLAERIDVAVLPAWPLFRYVQHGSTLIGAIVIGYFFHHQPQSTSTSRIGNLNYWLSIGAIAFSACSVRWAFGFEYFGDVVASAISCFVLGTILVSLYFTFRQTPSSHTPS